MRRVAPDQLAEGFELTPEVLPRLEVEADGEVRVVAERFRSGRCGCPADHQAGAGDDPLCMGCEDPPVDGGGEAEIVGVDYQRARFTHPVDVRFRAWESGSTPSCASPAI